MPLGNDTTFFHGGSWGHGKGWPHPWLRMSHQVFGRLHAQKFRGSCLMQRNDIRGAPLSTSCNPCTMYKGGVMSPEVDSTPAVHLYLRCCVRHTRGDLAEASALHTLAFVSGTFERMFKTLHPLPAGFKIYTNGGGTQTHAVTHATLLQQ